MKSQNTNGTPNRRDIPTAPDAEHPPSQPPQKTDWCYFKCRFCGAPIYESDYVGANIAKTILFYICPKCGRMNKYERRKA